MVLVGMPLLATAAVGEPTWRLSANEATYSYVCGGDDWIALDGKDNALTITGECSQLEIKGSNNRIKIEAVGTIRISGNNNDVRYERSSKGKQKPVFKIKGAANSIRRH
jgi:hypothetical protein